MQADMRELLGQFDGSRAARVAVLADMTREELEAVGGTGRWRGEAVTVKASDWAGVLTTRNVLDCTDPADAWAVPAGILAALVDT